MNDDDCMNTLTLLVKIWFVHVETNEMENNAFRAIETVFVVVIMLPEPAHHCFGIDRVLY